MRIYKKKIAMKKKEMVTLLVEHEGFDKKELNKLLKSEVEELFNEHFDVTEEDAKEDDGEEKIIFIEEQPKPLSKSEERRLRRVGYL